jgi:hypothetical protein
METKLMDLDAPVAPEGEQVEAKDVSRLGDGVSDMLGPVVVGGRGGADCFWSERTVQAGVKDPQVEWPSLDAGFVPQKRPW